MYTHFLVPTDGSALSEAAAASAIRLAKALGARITALHVVPDLADAPLEAWARGDTASRSRLRAVFEQQARQYLAAIEQQAKKAGVRCACISIAGGSPYEGILKTAADQGCDLIYMASHGRKGTSALVLGSETIKVLIHGTFPVLVHRKEAAPTGAATAADELSSSRKE